MYATVPRRPSRSSEWWRGDIVVLHAGDVVPADCRVVDKRSLHMNLMTAAGQSVLRCSPGALRRVGVDVPTAKVIAAGLLVTCIAISAAAKKVSWMIERSLVQPGTPTKSRLAASAPDRCATR